MKLSLITLFAYGTSLVTAAPQIARDAATLSHRDTSIESLNALEKRKGGGGGGKGGGGSSSGGSSSGGRSGSSSGGSSGSSGASGSGSTGGRGGSYSNAGGRTTQGSGPAPAYGNRYVGGATVPYTAGGVGPTRRLAPYAIVGAGAGFGAYYAASWIYPVYGYTYWPTVYSWNENGRNYTTNTTCLCQTSQVCGCDPTDDQAFLAQMLTNSTNGGGPPVNTSTIRTVKFDNGTAVTYINGSLPNGTTAAGGTEDAFGAGSKHLVSYGGYGIMAATVVASILMI